MQIPFLTGRTRNRLLKAAAAPDVRRAMEIEDEILSEIEDRDTTIMIKNQEIEEKEKVIEQKEQVIEQTKKDTDVIKSQQQASLIHKSSLLLFFSLPPCHLVPLSTAKVELAKLE